MSPGKLVVIDDSADHLELIESTVDQASARCELHTFLAGEDALRFLTCGGIRDASGNICPTVVLLDWKLSTMSGEEVLRHIRATAGIRFLPVVVMSSSREEVDVARAYELGVNSFVRKPVHYEEYSQAIFRVTDYWLNLNEPPPA